MLVAHEASDGERQEDDVLRVGLANMAYGVIIALVGALITGVSYAMVSGGGGTYVVAYGAFLVGAWRFLLGLFQVLRGAVSGPETGSAASGPQARGVASAASSPARTMKARTMNQDISGALSIVGWALIADAALRIYSLGFVLWRLRVPLTDVFSNVSVLVFFVTAIVLPALLIVGAAAAAALLFRNRPTAISFGFGLCVASLLFQAYGLWRLSTFASRVPWITWAFVSAHLAIYVVSLVILLRSSNRRTLGAPAPLGQDHVPASPVTRL